MEHFITKYGDLSDIGEHILYPNGMLKECMFLNKQELDTEYGVLVPQYEFDEDRRKYNYSLSLYEDGSLRKISMNDPTEILTPIGNRMAELLIFYQSGKLKRLFPLNGRLSAYWEEHEEYTLAITDTITMPCGTICAKLIAISFYEEGRVKDLTIWPKEPVKVMTPVGEMRIRIGISFYPGGEIKSVEPSFPTKVMTPIGEIKAFDYNANGLCGDQNSLQFTVEGKIKSLITSGQRVIVVNRESGALEEYSPSQDCDEDGIEISFSTLQIDFEEEYVIIEGNHYYYEENDFVIEAYYRKAPGMCSDCASCGMCG